MALGMILVAVLAFVSSTSMSLAVRQIRVGSVLAHDAMVDDGDRLDALVH